MFGLTLESKEVQNLLIIMAAMQFIMKSANNKACHIAAEDFIRAMYEELGIPWTED